MIKNGRTTTWLDAQHQYTAIAQRAVQRPALHAVVAIAATAVTVATDQVRTRPTPRREAAGADGVVSADLAAVQGRVGRDRDRP